MNDTILGKATLSGRKAEEFMKFLAETAGSKDDSVPRDVQVLRLQEAYRQLQVSHEFKPGDLVQVKPGLYGNLNYPKPGQPAIIAKLHNPPLIDKEAGLSDPHFGQTFDVSLRVVMDDERIVEFGYASEWLEPYQS